jgi:phosphoenolpyruvate carboxylase
MSPTQVNQAGSADKDLPLREDIRLLGTVLGDTIHSKEGDVVFGLVESIQQNSVRFHREEDDIARRNLEAMLNSLSPRQTTRIIRAFSYFSHLANIAEDLHHIRRTREHTLAGGPPPRWGRGPPRGPGPGALGPWPTRSAEPGRPASRPPGCANSSPRPW